MSKTLSDKQLAANRANATRSTGPRTPEGKARSSQNARKHGFAASTFAVVRLEDLNEIANLKADLVACYQPVNTQELFTIERIALAQHAILRAARLEVGMFTTCLDETLDREGQAMLIMNPGLAGDGDIEVTRAQNRNYLLGSGFHRMAQKANSWSLFLRYQAQAERQYRRAVEEFERLKGLRAELPNEPVREAEPEENQPDPPLQVGAQSIPVSEPPCAGIRVFPSTGRPTGQPAAAPVDFGPKAAVAVTF